MTFDQVRADFWGWGAHTPTESRVIRHRSVELTSADEDQAILAARNDWMIGEELVLEEALHCGTRAGDVASPPTATTSLPTGRP